MQIFKSPLSEAIAATEPAKQAGLDAAGCARFFSTPPNPDLGDLAFGCFAFSKALKTKPPEAAKAILEALQAGSPELFGEQGIIAEAKLAGPYLNFFIKPQALAKQVIAAVNQASPGWEPSAWSYGNSTGGAGKSVAIDLSSPNIAKPLGVHHLRSTMIGNALANIYRACGWKAIGINHLGDWGTSFGKLIYGFCEAMPQLADQLAEVADDRDKLRELFADIDIAKLNTIYVDFSKRASKDTSLESKGKEEFNALENAILARNKGDAESAHGKRNRAVWQAIKEISLREFETVYDLLGLSFTPWPLRDQADQAAYEADPDAYLNAHGLYTGESYYVGGSTHCDALIEQAKTSGAAVESEGALVIFTDGEDKPPLMLLKNDGATSYHTRDMAAAIYRRDTFGMDKGLYAVGGEQRLHFKQLFKGLEMLGYEWGSECEHVDFGLVLSFDEELGKWTKFTTRGGRTVLLHDLLNEAISAVEKIIAEKNPELAADKALTAEIAEAVGVGAVVFNDLKNGRRADVKFDWDEMLSFSGDTGPYMLMQYVRLGSVRRKYVDRYGEPGEADTSLLTSPHERELLKAIANFPEVVERACRENEASVISRYLLDTSAVFSSYWTATKGEGIVGDDQALSTARIALVDVLRKVLGRGLNLLGLRLVDRM